MKPGAGLRRTAMPCREKPLKSRGGQLCRTELKRGDKPLARKTPLPPINKERQARKTKAAGMSKSEAKRIVRTRSGGLCEFRFPGVCRGRGTNIAHIKPEGQGGLYVPSNLIMSCGFGNNHGGCHGWQENNRAEAYEKGWLVRSRADHRKHPVWMWYRGAWGEWLLDDKGTAVPAPKRPEVAA